MSHPAKQSFLPFLDTLEKLPQAIAWNASAYRTAVIPGPALGGFLYDLGPAVNYSLCLGLYIFTIIAMWNLRIRVQKSLPCTSSTFARILDGIVYMRQPPILFG